MHWKLLLGSVLGWQLLTSGLAAQTVGPIGARRSALAPVRAAQARLHVNPRAEAESAPLLELSMQQREIGVARGRLGNLYAGTALAEVGNSAQERAAFSQALAKIEATMPSEPLPPLPLPPMHPVEALQSAAEQLRNLARNLDSLAADTEDAGNYPRADRLRMTAQRLRHEARDLLASRTTEAETRR